MAANCRTCNAQLRPGDTVCPECGETDPKGKGETPGGLGKSALRITVLLALLLSAPPLAMYGTLSPCGMLKQEGMRYITEKADAQMRGGNKFEQTGTAIGLAIGERNLEARIEGMSPMECATGLWRVKTREI